MSESSREVRFGTPPWKVLVLKWCPTLCDTPWTVAHQGPPSGDSPGKNTGVGCQFLLQGIFLTQGTNPGLPHCRWIYHPRATREAPPWCPTKLQQGLTAPWGYICPSACGAVIPARRQGQNQSECCWGRLILIMPDYWALL